MAKMSDGEAETAARVRVLIQEVRETLEEIEQYLNRPEEK